MEKRPPDDPGGSEPGIDPDRFERRALELVRKRRQQYLDVLAASAGGPPLDLSPWDRIRAFFTFRNLSVALNVVFLVVILAAARERYLYSPYPIEVTVEQNPGELTSADTRELVIVREVTGQDGERDTVWARAFEGIVIQAQMTSWRHSRLDRRQRYLVVAILRFGAPGAISVWDVRERNPDRQLVWEREVSLEEMEGLFPPEMTKGRGAWCNGFALADLDADGEAEVAAMFHHDVYFPACIRTFERDGSVRGTYWNWGYFDAILACDVDGDGREEIVASGTNNVFQGGTLVMLDAEHLSGYSLDEAAALRMTEAGLGADLDREPFRQEARVRVVFPLWDPEVAAFARTNRIHAGSLAFIGSPPSFKVKIGTGIPAAWKARRAAARGTPLPEGKDWVDVRLDAQLRPTDIIVPDGLTARLRVAREAGELGVEADSRRFWAEWLGSYRYIGPDDPAAAAPIS